MPADPLSGLVCVVQCGASSCLVVNSHIGLSSDNNGTQQAYDGFGVLRIDPSLRGREYTYTVVHEFTHDYNPRWSEETVKEFSTQLTDLLYVDVIRKLGGLDV